MQNIKKRFKVYQIIKAILFSFIIGVFQVTGFGAGAIEFEESVTGQTVQDRSRPEVDPRGIRSGGFILYPSATLTTEYDSNIFAQDKNFFPIFDDLIVIISPEIILASNWNRHQLNFWMGADVGFFISNSTEDFEDFDVGMEGRIDFKRNTNLTIDARYRRLHEDKGSPDAARGINPSEYDKAENNVVFYHAINRVSIQLRSGLTYYDFDDVPTTVGVIIQDDRDRLEWLGTVRLGYDVTSSVRLFLIGYYDIRDYDDSLDRNGFARDSNGYSFGFGGTVELTGKLSFEAFIGYQDHNWKIPPLPAPPGLTDIDGIVWWLEGIWLPGGMTTVSVYTRRVIDETIQPFASGFFRTEGGVTVDHELLRNLIGSAVISYETWDYRGITRNDKYLRTGLELSYLMNRNVRVVVAWRFTDRESNVFSQDYNKHRLSLGVRGAF